MNANDSPTVQRVAHRLKYLVKQGKNLVDKGVHDDGSMLGPEILSQLELLASNDEKIPVSQHPLVEASARDILYPLLRSTNINKPSFREIWILLDIIHILGNHGNCEAALFFLLVEELLDSQSIDGCRKVFDYLESRRERLVAKDFHKKHLVILRSCNELLRRLSRAEDAIFCGRVFIFLFQSFPLGDKSSVNLRGEFHVENVTTFEKPIEDSEGPDDEAAQNAQTHFDSIVNAENTSAENISKVVEQGVKIQNTNTDQANKDLVLDTNAFYPIFWTLQEAFSNPPRLFDQQNLNNFKKGLQSTIENFEQVSYALQGSNSERKRGLKRRFSGEGDEFANNYNPKYLTSKDLFKLELYDHLFQRHILVQALILIDFLLSLTEKAKSKLQTLQVQKALQYSFTLEEEDAKWAIAVKGKIAGYLQDGPDGKFYYRMVDTVLTRDKNWVRWKLESCPPITRPPASSEDLAAAKTGISKAGANKRLRPSPMGSLNLGFLSDPEAVNSLQSLKQFDRYELPSGESLLKSIDGDELDKEIAATEEERKDIDQAMLSKTWKLLRVTSKTKLAFFDKINNGKELHNLFQTSWNGSATTGEDEKTNKNVVEVGSAKS